MISHFYSRFGRTISFTALVCLPFLLYGALGAFQNQTNNVLDWLPGSFPETAQLVRFANHFGSDEILVISWPGCTTSDPRLDRFARQLRQPSKDPAGGERRRLFREVLTGRGLLAELTSPPLNLSQSAALARMQGWLVGPDGQTTCALAFVSDGVSANAQRDREAALDAVFTTASSVGIAPQEVRVGGPTADSVAIDRASRHGMVAMVLLFALVALLAAWACFRQIRLVLIIVFTAAFAWAVSLTLLHMSPAHLDAVLLMMPGLVFLLAISGAVHLTNYYQDALRESGAENAAAEAIVRGWMPSVFALGTTAVGLGSLAFSQLTPVERFGRFSTYGVLATLVILLVIWPSAMHGWMPSGKASTTGRGRWSFASGESSHWWHPLYRLATQRYAFWLLLTALLIPPLALGISRIEASATLADLLPPSSKHMRDYVWLEEHVGPLVPVEIVLRLNPGGATDRREFMRRVELVETLRHKIDGLKEVDGTVAATTFTPKFPKGRGARQVMQRRLLAEKLQRRRDQFVQSRYLADRENEELWRITTRIGSLHHRDFRQLLDQLANDVRRLLKETPTTANVDVSFEICGAIPLISMAQQQLLKDLVKSFLIAFLLIAATMLALMRSFMAGILSMIPNAFPAVLVFGIMGWSSSAVDIGAMMTASAALGIAVDDTLHFLVWFRRGLLQGKTRDQAIHFAYQRCATAMLQTSIICGVGFLIFVLSDFAPIARFGRLMATLLFSALVGDLLLLPALLTSPLGRFFVPKTASDDSSASGKADVPLASPNQATMAQKPGG